jgi:DNA-directed RNA polymerase subunit K/omega
MSKPITLSRGPTVDTQKCVEVAGGNRFDLVIMAAARAREIRRQHASSQKFEHVHTTVSALLDFQNGECGADYMKKIKFNQPSDRRIDRSAKYNT